MASSFITLNTPDTYKTPLSGGGFYFVSARTIFAGSFDVGGIYPNETINRIIYYMKVVQVIGGEEKQLFYGTYSLDNQGNTSGDDVGFSTTLSSGGSYKVYYGWNLRGARDTYLEASSYSFPYVVDNQLPLKKWTATDVINRVLDLAEPIRKGETPRFRLQGMNSDGSIQEGSQADLFNQILSPEFAFTKQTLRECLQQVGEIIHGEPRLSIAQDTDGTYYYEVSYDLYGQTEQWKHAHRAYVKKDVTQNVNSYASSVDTHAENLLNKRGDDYGTITEPYANGAKTVRTEQMYVQITETNMLIPTQFPVYTVEKLEWVRSNNGTLQSVDITPYLFESSIYGARLSSYDSQYPYSKAYALMYTQGEKNITQLSFKPENPISAVFENYAILNILRAASGDNNLSFDEYSYPQLAFRVTYTPFYQSRVGQTKVDYKDYLRPAVMIYNQQSNVVDSRAYGENLKGVIARLGNAEKSYTYRLSRLSQIPKAGMMFDDDYAISAVYTEILPTVINCTIGLTKNFNRISRYVGISSVKRFSQVSQTMAIERNILWSEYLVIGDDFPLSDYDVSTRAGTGLLNSIENTFTQGSQFEAPLTQVTAWGTTGEDNPLHTVSLPVIASAFGNSISFSWEYADNYSAGPVSVYQQGTGDKDDVKGYFQNDYRYTDYYGKLYYYDFSITQEGDAITADNYLDVGNDLPGSSGKTPGAYYISTVNYEPYILRKDNREKLQCNYQLNFVSNRKGLIIGSALAANCPAIIGTDRSRRARLYVLPERLNKFADNVRSHGIDISSLPNASIVTTSGPTNKFYLDAGEFPASGKAWAICTPITTKTEQVETETGAIETQTITQGGDILLAQNVDITEGDAFNRVTFSLVRDIFDRDVWKEIQ